MGGIFISYRRSDSDFAAGRLGDDLSGIFGRGSIFRDVDTLEPGEEYENALDHALKSCVVLIAVIGPRWSTITDDNGRRRLEDSNDWVRIEISQALTRRIRVIPLLIGATVPQEGDLPTELKPLVKRHAFEMSDRHWRQDLELLTQSLEKIPGMARRISLDQTTPLRNPPLEASMVERTMRVPDRPPVRQSSGSWIFVAALIAVALIGGAEWYLEVEKLVKSNKTWFPDWLFAPGVIWKLIIAALAMLAMAAWISVSIASTWRPGGGTAVERLKLAFVSTTGWFFYVGPLIIFVFALVAQYCAPEEPLPFFSGIGIWASEMLRMVAFMLAIFFMFKAGFDLRVNARDTEEVFSFAPLPLTRFRWRDLGMGLEHWQMTEDGFSPEEAWHAYLRRNKFWPRFIRIGVLLALYLLFSFAIYKLFPPPSGPFRGDMAFKIDRVVSRLSGASLLLLSFYVADAIQLNSNFICMFRREVTKWGRRVVDRSHRSPPLTEEELSAYFKVFFVAQRTRVVAPLIWYPLLVLTLLIIARSSFFDNSLFLICSITAAWALGGAISLRRAAEQLRETALSDLRRFRLLGHESQAKRQVFDEITAEICDLKTGAFAPLTEQPFIRAFLLAGGAVGLLAVHQRLLDIF